MPFTILGYRSAMQSNLTIEDYAYRNSSSLDIVNTETRYRIADSVAALVASQLSV